VTVQPDYVVGREGTTHVLRNGAGERFRYPDPPSTDLGCPYEAVWYRER
jgi:hypothetical protein